MSAPDTLDFPTFVAVVRRRIWLILGAAAAFWRSSSRALFPDRYDASADVLFHQPATAPASTRTNRPRRSRPGTGAGRTTNLALASLDLVAVRVKQKIDATETEKQLAKRQHRTGRARLTS